MDHTTLLVTAVVVATWAVLFVAWLLWDDIEEWWQHRRARAARRRHRAFPYIPSQRSAR